MSHYLNLKQFTIVCDKSINNIVFDNKVELVVLILILQDTNKSKARCNTQLQEEFITWQIRILIRLVLKKKNRKSCIYLNISTGNL